MARRRTRRRIPLRHPLAGAIVLALAGLAQAQNLPTGEHGYSGIAGGADGFVRTPNSLTIEQSAQNAIINWETFSIGQNYSVRFNQPNSSSIALNRVHGGQVSEIRGGLSANGRVFLLNPSGVLFGGSAQVDVGGLVASTMAIGDDEFLAGASSGTFRFVRSGNATVQVQTGASLETAAGSGMLALLADVVTNAGTITANGGSVLFGSGQTLDLNIGGDGLTTLRIRQNSDSGVSSRLTNTGTLQADGGHVGLHLGGWSSASVIEQEGTIVARSLRSREGRIVLESGYYPQFSDDPDFNATGRIEVSGSQDASAAEAGVSGGHIRVSGRRLLVEGEAAFDAGGSGGGNGLLELVSERSVRVLEQSGIDAISDDVHSYLRDRTLGDALGNGTDVAIHAVGEPYTSTPGRIGTVEFGAWDSGSGQQFVANVVKRAGGDARLTFNADHSIAMTQSTITSEAGRLDVDFNTDSGANATNYVNAGSVSMDASEIRSNGGHVRFYGRNDPVNGYAGGNFYVHDGINIFNSTIDTCASAAGQACGSSAGSILLRGRGYDQVQSDGIGINLVGATTLRSSAGDIVLDGLGGVGQSGVRFFSDQASPVRVLADTGRVSIRGVSQDEPAGNTFAVAAPAAAVAIANAQIESGGGIGIEGRGADLRYSLSIERPPLEVGWTGGVDISDSALQVAQGGEIDIAGEAGSEVLFRVSDDLFITLPSYGVNLTADTALVAPSGEIRVRGVESARGLPSNVYLSGRIDTGSGTGRGGGVFASGSNLFVGETAFWSAAGAAGGGRIDAEAEGILAIAPGASMDASGLDGGSGGSIRLFGTGGLRAFGTLAARGGATGGDGGFIETSGGALDLRGIGIDAGAANGVAGTWLIDPYDVYIVHGDASGSLPDDPFVPLFDATIQDGDINNALNAGTSVHITTGGTDVGDSNGDIVFSADSGLVRIERTVGDAELTFRLDANRAIRTEGYTNGDWIEGFTIDGGDGPLHVHFNADANGTADPVSEDAGIHLVNANIASRGGDVWFYGQGDPDQGFARSEGAGISLESSVIDTRDGAGNDGEVRLRGEGAYGGGVYLYTSRIDSGSGDQHIVGRALYSGDGVRLSGDLGLDDDNVWTELHSDGGSIRVVGLATGDFSDARGVSLHVARVTNEGGDVEIHGRASNATGYLAMGVWVGESAYVGSAATSRVRIVGEAAGTTSDQIGLHFGAEGGCGTSDAACVNGVDVVLQAATGDGSPAIHLYGDVEASRVINLRPGGVDAEGNAYERPSDALVIGGAGGFIVGAGGQAGLGNLQAPDIVVGSDIQTGLVQVQAALQRSGNLTLQAGGTGAAGIAINGALDVDGYTLALVSTGDIVQSGSGAITAGSLLARSTGGDVLLASAVNNVTGNTLAGGADGQFQYVDADALRVGAVDAVGFTASGNAPQALSASGLDAGDNVFVRNLDGDLTLAAGIGAGNDITLVTAGRLQNAGGATLAAGNLWRVWASTWVGETRGGLAGSGPLPNLYNCAYGGSPACGVAGSISASDNQFIYAQQPTATVVIGSHAREYGLANPALGHGVSGLILDDIAANAIVGGVSTDATIQSNVGQYPIFGSFTSPAGYAVNVLPGVLDITQATLLYVANPYTRIYGDPEGVLTGTVTGFRNDDTLAGATTGTLAFTSGTDVTTGVGNHAITGGGLDALNYRFEQAPGNATAYRIDPATLLYVANFYTRIYGDPEGVLTGTVTGFRNDDTLAGATTGTLVFTSGTDVTTGVGNHAITGGGLGAANYVFAQAPGNATAYRIDPATLWYVANPYSRQIGQPNGVLTGTVAGFRNGDTLAGATTGTLVFNSPANENSPAGVYAIEGGGLDAGNYVFAQAPDNATALRVYGFSGTLFASDLIREPQDNYLYDRNIGAAPMCPILADLLRTGESDDDDVLAREWSRVKTRPNLTNCIQGGRRNGCDDF